MRTRLVLLGGQTIALGLMMAFLVVPASALFLAEYGADRLAYAYLAVAAAGVAVSSALSRFQRQVSLASLATGVFTTYLVVVAAAWAVLTWSGGLWVTFPLLVLFPLSIPTGFAMVGGQSGRLLDVRQMKAYFPRVAAGFPVGFALGGVVAALLVEPLGGPDQLLAVDLVAAAAMVGLVVATGRRYPIELRAAPQQAQGGQPAGSESRRVLLRNRLVVMILGYQILSAAATQLLDFMVWERAAARYPDPSDLARFQGVFGAIINVTSVLFVVLLAGWMLTRFGIGVGLLANPVAVLALLCVTSVVGLSAGPSAFVFFAFVCAQEVIDLTLTDGTTRTSINATYQALLPHQRLQAQTMVEGAGVPIALGLVGLLLLLQNALDLGIGMVLVVTIAVTVVWTVFSLHAFREYGANLRQVLTRRAWDPVALRIDDEVSRGVVESLLTSADLRDTETALEALADADSPHLAGHVAALLGDTDPARRRLAVEVAGSARLLSTDGVGPEVRALMNDPDGAVRLAAVAVLAAGADEPGQTARASWSAASHDHDEVVVRAALASAARSPDPFFVPRLVEMAAAPSAPAELFDALVAHSEQLQPVVERMRQEGDVPRLAKQRILSALGEAGTPRSRELLLGLVADPDPAVAEAAARALVAAGHMEHPDERAFGDALAVQATRALRCLQLLAGLPDAAGTEPLRGALEDEVALAAQRTEVLLGLVHEPRVIGFGVAGLRAELARDRSTALEALEVTVGRREARLLLAFAGLDHDAPARLRLFAEYAEAEPGSPGDLLRELVLDPQRYWDEPWLRACALYALPTVAPEEAASLAAPYVESTDPIVAETARWALHLHGHH